jgi:hypothetical protein
MENNDPPPKKKGVFKGKRPKVKFSRNLNTRKDSKQSTNRAAAQEGSAPPASATLPAPTASFATRATRDRLAALKTTTSQLKKTEGQESKEERKRTRAENLAASHSDAVKAARQDAREAKSAARE